MISVEALRTALSEPTDFRLRWIVHGFDSSKENREVYEAIMDTLPFSSALSCILGMHVSWLRAEVARTGIAPVYLGFIEPHMTKVPGVIIESTYIPPVACYNADNVSDVELVVFADVEKPATRVLIDSARRSVVHTRKSIAFVETSSRLEPCWRRALSGLVDEMMTIP